MQEFNLNMKLAMPTATWRELVLIILLSIAVVGSGTRETSVKLSGEYSAAISRAATDR